MQKIGVFVCHCGTNIAATVDVEAVAKTLGKEPGVVFAADYPYMCSQTGQQMIQDKIHELGLTGVVICSCSPRMHEQTFRKACAKACTQGLNVMQYIAYAQRGEYEKCAEESFDCVMCGVCSLRCPAGISHPQVAMLARRLNGKYLASHCEHLDVRVEEIREGKYEALIESLMEKPLAEIKELYNHRDIEA